MSHFRDDLSIMEALQHGIKEQVIPTGPGKKNQTEVVDEKVRYCPECKDVWELHKDSGMYRLMIYEDFPTIGKKREECPNCRKQRGEKTFLTRPGGRGSNLPWSRLHLTNKEKNLRNGKAAKRS